MTDNEKFWEAIQENLPKKTWIPIKDIFDMVKHKVKLDDEDLALFPSPGKIPRWKSNVKILLRSKREAGSVHSRRGEG